MKLKKSLGEEIIAFCKANNIEDVSAFLNKITEIGFMQEKYGLKPTLIKKETPVQNKSYADLTGTLADKTNALTTPEEKIIDNENDDYEVYD